jgi:hypothetical protein
MSTGYRPPSREPKGTWARHLHAFRKAHGWSQTRAFEEWGEQTQRWQAGLADLRRVMAERPGRVVVAGPMEPATIALPIYVPEVGRVGSGPCIGAVIAGWPEPDCPVVVRLWD